MTKLNTEGFNNQHYISYSKHDSIDPKIGVYSKITKEFIPFIFTENENRVRIDVFDDLENYEAYSCNFDFTNEEIIVNVCNVTPLDYIIDLT